MKAELCSDDYYYPFDSKTSWPHSTKIRGSTVPGPSSRRQPSPAFPYTGSLTISDGKVDGHRLRWKTNGGEYTGIGLVIDGRLWMAFGEGEAYGLCIYQQGAGRLEGTFTAPSYGGLAGWEHVLDIDSLPTEEAIFKIEGHQPDKVSYTGQIAFKPYGEMYLMRWVFEGATGSWVGVGMQRHGRLVTAYGAQSDFSWGCGCYEVQEDGTLRGEWAIPAYPEAGREVFGMRH
ncbi:MAG: hypothetical protein U0176_08985 [Bacteroidia bacterium]